MDYSILNELFDWYDHLPMHAVEKLVSIERRYACLINERKPQKSAEKKQFATDLSNWGHLLIEKDGYMSPEDHFRFIQEECGLPLKTHILYKFVQTLIVRQESDEFVAMIQGWISRDECHIPIFGSFDEVSEYIKQHPDG